MNKPSVEDTCQDRCPYGTMCSCTERYGRDGRKGIGHECILAIVGSVSLMGNAEADAAVQDAFDRHDPRRFVSGGAPGIDTMAERKADRRHCEKHIYEPAERRWNALYGFKWRNTRIAVECEHLVRISDCRSKTYGSGWTARKAERLGKQVEEIVIHTCRGVCNV